MSASMTLSDDLVRSWLRSRRTVSWLASTSSLPPATNPATSTRWNGVTSIFGWMGVSIGISKYVGPHATNAAAPAPISTTSRRLRRVLAGWGRAVIDFLEELVILADLAV